MGILYIEMGTEKIKDYEYADTNYTDIFFAPTVKKIGAGAFKGCKNIKKILIPYGVEQIEYGAFEDCENLEDITFAHSVKIIDECVFKNCNKLKSAMFMSTTNEMKEKYISNDAFPESTEIIWKRTYKEYIAMGYSEEKAEKCVKITNLVDNMNFIKRM